MPVKLSAGTLATIIFIALSLAIAACQKQETSIQEPTEARLRQRIMTAKEAFLNGKFDDFIEMRTLRQRKMSFESEEDKKKTLSEWRLFLEHEKPSMELVNIEIHGLKAIAKMKGEVQRKDLTRSESTMYDLWIFENGDWYLDTAGRASPDYFPS